MGCERLLGVLGFWEGLVGFGRCRGRCECDGRRCAARVSVVVWLLGEAGFAHFDLLVSYRADCFQSADQYF